LQSKPKACPNPLEFCPLSRRICNPAGAAEQLRKKELKVAPLWKRRQEKPISRNSLAQWRHPVSF
jgi:hypothetical protein